MQFFTRRETKNFYSLLFYCMQLNAPFLSLVCGETDCLQVGNSKSLSASHTVIIALKNWNDNVDIDDLNKLQTLTNYTYFETDLAYTNIQFKYFFE